MKQFAFIHNGTKRHLNAKCIGKAVKMITAEYPELKKLSLNEIKLQTR